MENKRLLVVEASSLLAGSQKITLKIVDSLSDKGFEIYSLLKHDDSLFDGYYKRFNNHQFLMHKLLNRFFGTGDFSIKNLSFQSKLLLFFSVFISNLQVIYTAKKHRIYNIYCYDPKGIILCGLFAKFFKLKVIWHLHGKLNFGNKINRFLLGMADEVIVPSCSIADNFINIRDDINVIYNGFEFKECDKLYEKKTDVINLLFIGTIVPNKGLHVLIENLINSNFKENVILNVLGSPVGDIGIAYKKYIIELINDLPKNVLVEFHGWVNNPYDFIKKSDLLLFSSLEKCRITLNGEEKTFSASEGLPTVLIESIALGTPVLANKTTGVNEIVYDSCFGTVVDDISLCDFDKEIKEIIERRKNIPTTDFFKKFSINTMNESIFNIINR
ncbi:glycosyltransferase [Photobacterium leiognathi]|nr:glycosyltransferase [Photobacterium leiognathi]KJF91576.1 hypothetical protein UB42_01840 [Photobacterium leiognathi]